MIEIAHQRRAGLAAGNVPRRAAHVDVDDVGAGGFRDPRALGHPVRLATRQLDHVRTDPGRFAAQLRHRAAVHQIVAGGHFGDHESGAEGRGQTSKGRVGDARHRRQKDPVRDGNIAYLQWLKA